MHGYGYRFGAEIDVEEPTVTDATGRAVCWLLYGSREIALQDGEHMVGRDRRRSYGSIHPTSHAIMRGLS